MNYVTHRAILALRYTQKSFVIVRYSKPGDKDVYLLHRTRSGQGITVNAFEIEQIEKQMRSELRLPLAYDTWADIERHAREERSRAVGEALAGFFSAVLAAVAGFARQIRGTAAQCTGARLRHDH